MSDIATKLTYLSGTKDLLKTTINYTGANITNDTFRSYPKKLKDAYIDIINNGTDTLYSNLPKVSGKGTNLSLTPTYEAPMRSELYGDTLQNGTPTPDTPVEIQSVTGLQNINVCGKNLCFNITKPANANLKFFINKSISKTFTISFTTNEALSNNSLYLEIDGTSYGNIGGITASANTRVEKTYTLSDTNYQAIQNGTNIDLLLYKNGANFNIPTDGMVENSSTTTTYEPYNGNTYEVNLGKNLLNPNGTTTDINGILFTNNGDGTFHAYGTATDNTNFALTTSNLILNNNTAYTQSVKTINGTQVGSIVPSFKDSNGTINWNYFYNNQTKTTTDRMSLYQYNYYVPNGSQVDWTFSVMLEKGSTATSYSPYFTPIELNKISTYEDRIYKDSGKWYLEKNIGKVVLNGSENSWAIGQGGWYSQSFTSLIEPSSQAISNKYVYTSNTWQGNYTFSINSSSFLAISDDRFPVRSDWINYLINNNIEIKYILQTPTTTEITNTTLINQLETLYNAQSKDGTTNISSSSNDLPMVLSVSTLKGAE